MPQPDRVVRLAHLIERAARLVQGDLHAHGLPPAQWQALGYLARANRFSRTPGALGHYVGATKGTVSQTLVALSRKGLVAKMRGGEDRRSVTLTLTQRGSELLAEHPLRQIVEALSGLEEAERCALEQGVESLLGELLRIRGGRTFGQCRTCRFFRPNGGRGGDGPHRCALLDVPLSRQDSIQICHEHTPAA